MKANEISDHQLLIWNISRFFESTRKETSKMWLICLCSTLLVEGVSLVDTTCNNNDHRIQVIWKWITVAVRSFTVHGSNRDARNIFFFWEGLCWLEKLNSLQKKKDSPSPLLSFNILFSFFASVCCTHCLLCHQASLFTEPFGFKIFSIRVLENYTSLTFHDISQRRWVNNNVPCS